MAFRGLVIHAWPVFQPSSTGNSGTCLRAEELWLVWPAVNAANEAGNEMGVCQRIYKVASVHPRAICFNNLQGRAQAGLSTVWAKKVGTEVLVMGERKRTLWFGFEARRWDKMKRSKALLKSPT